MARKYEELTQIAMDDPLYQDYHQLSENAAKVDIIHHSRLVPTSNRQNPLKIKYSCNRR